MTPREAVTLAFTHNNNWMSSHTGIVKFILSECDPANELNEEYDNAILANPDAARNEAKLLDAQGRSFRVDLSLTIPESTWARAYGNELDAEGVREFLQNALFISTDHIAVSVNSIVDENE